MESFRSEASLTISPVFDESEASEHIYKLESGVVEFFCVVRFDDEEICGYEIYFAEWFRKWEDSMHALVSGWFNVEVDKHDLSGA